MRTIACLTVAAAAAASAASAPTPSAPTNALCFPQPYDPATCLSWHADAANITFTAVWPASGSLKIGWGGWGISSLTCGSMYPASVSMVFVGPGGVTLEDRAAVGHVQPQCRKMQLSHVTASRVEPDGSVTVSWTRPLVAPPASGQPSIVPGNVSIIGAIFYGPLDLRPCESTGIPGHQGIASFTAELLPAADSDAVGSGPGELPALAPTPAPAPAPATGLVATFLVCSNAYTNLARVTPAGVERFYGASSPLALLPGVSTVDVAGRRLYSLLESVTGLTFDLVSLDVDSGERGATCATPLPVPANYPLQNLNIAFDEKNGTVIVAGCTDSECAGYVGVLRVDPATCAITPVVKVPTDPPLSAAQSSAAFDPATETFVMIVTQVVAKRPAAPVLVSVDMRAGRVLHSFPEGDTNFSIAALSPAGPGRFLGVNVRADLSVSMATFDSAHNKATLAPAVPGCVQALPGLSALERRADGDVFYFFTQDGASGAARLIGVFAANGTLASAGTLPGDYSQTPSSFFML